MLTTQSVWPSASTRPFSPGAMSATAHTRTSGIGARHRIAVLDLLEDAAAQRPDERRQRELREHVVEETEHDEPLRLIGGHAAAREVVELLLVDGADGAGMRAAHVVGLD